MILRCAPTPAPTPPQLEWEAPDRTRRPPSAFFLRPGTAENGSLLAPRNRPRWRALWGLLWLRVLLCAAPDVHTREGRG